MASKIEKRKTVTFGQMCDSYAMDADIECRFVCHDFTPTSAHTIVIIDPYGTHLTISLDDCPIVDSETGERSVRFSAAQLPDSTGIHGLYILSYLSDVKPVRISCGSSTLFRVVSEDNVNQLENKSSDSEEEFVVISSQKELMSKTNEVKDLSKLCAEQEVQNKGYGAERSQQLDESKGRVEELELSQTKQLKDNFLFNCPINERNIRQYFEVMEVLRNNRKIEKSWEEETNEVKDLSKRCAELEQQVKGYGAENRRLLNELRRSKERVEELELKSSEEVLESREKTADQQVLISELNAIRSSFEAKLEESSVSIAKVMSERRDIDSENKLLRNSLEEMDRLMDVMTDKWKEREQSMVNEWQLKECLFETQLYDMTSRLASPSDENQTLLEQMTRIETKIDEMINKHNYFETKTQTNGASNDSTTECNEVKAREERPKPLSELLDKRGEEMPKHSIRFISKGWWDENGKWITNPLF